MEWIEASKTKPESYRYVYLYSELTGVREGYYNGSYFEINEEAMNPDEYEITHWLPKYLPKPPKTA